MVNRICFDYLIEGLCSGPVVQDLIEPSCRRPRVVIELTYLVEIVWRGVG